MARGPAGVPGETGACREEAQVKKLAIGCLIVVVVLAIGAGIAGYYVYSKAKGYVQQFQAVATLDKDVTNKAAFTPPGNNELTEDSLRRFIAVQESMHARLGARIDELKAKQDELQRRQETEHRQASPTEALSTIAGMMGLIVEAKKAQVDALNQQKFSLDEYDWVRKQLNIGNLPEAVSQGGGATQPLAEAGAEVPARNKELVAPYLPKLKDWAVLAFFGL
jgi:hypothetical protein